MGQFLYEARDGSGQLTSGSLVAASLAEASRQLRAEGKFPVRIDPASAGAAAKASPAQSGGRVKRDEVIYFAHQIAVMIDTGVTLGEALETVAEQTTNPAFKSVMDDVNNRVQSGSSLSDALAAHRRVFPELMTSLIRASEASGTMSQMLERICIYLNKERETIKKVRGAMIYPMVMTLFALTVTVFLLIFVLPRFAKIYATRGAALPLPTQILLGTSSLLIDYWYIWVSLSAGLTVVGWWFFTRPVGRRFVDLMKLKLPIIGPMFNQLYLTRAMRTMGTMIAAGVPMLDMIQIARAVTHNSYYEDLWDEVDQQVQSGSQLSQPLFDSSLIPASIARMVHSGEKAGRLGTVMERVAEFTEKDFDETVARCTQFIEPAMIGFMGGLIGFVAISLLLPIFSVSSVVAGQ